MDNKNQWMYCGNFRTKQVLLFWKCKSSSSECTGLRKQLGRAVTEKVGFLIFEGLSALVPITKVNIS